MKKIYSILLVALVVFTGCQQWLEEDPIAKVGTVDPSITTSAVSDSSFTAKISGVDGTSYYAYAVLKGEATSVNADKLFQKGLGSAYAEGVVNYAEAPSTTIVLKDLVPNTKYTVYAIAGNSQSFTGNVVTATVLTSDSLVPEITKVATADSIFSITFNEPVERGEGAIKAYIIAKNYSWSEPVDVIAVPEEDIEVKGTSLSVVVPGAPAGAYVVLSFAEGVVVNKVGTPSEAYSPFENGYYEDWEDADFDKYEFYYDVYSHMTNDTWELTWLDENEARDTCVYISPDEWADTYVAFAFDRQIAAMGEATEKNPYPVRVKYSEGGKVSSIPADWKLTSDYAFMYFPLPEELEVLGTVDLSVEAAMFEDIYGNPSAAFGRDVAYSCLLVSTGIEGVYKISYTNLFDESYSGKVYFEKNEDGTYSIYGLSPYLSQYGYWGELIASANEDESELTAASGQLYDADLGATFYALDDEFEAPIAAAKFSVLESGWLTLDNNWGLINAAGQFYDAVPAGVTFIKISNELPAPTAAPAAKQATSVKSRNLK